MSTSENEYEMIWISLEYIFLSRFWKRDCVSLEINCKKLKVDSRKSSASHQCIVSSTLSGCCENNWQFVRVSSLLTFIFAKLLSSYLRQVQIIDWKVFVEVNYSPWGWGGNLVERGRDGGGSHSSSQKKKKSSFVAPK